MKHSVLFLVLGFLYSCNPQEDYYPTLEFILGADKVCTAGTDLNTCQMLSDRCQPAFDDAIDEFGEPVFASCIAKTDEWVTPSVPVEPAPGEEVIPVEDVAPPTIVETLDAKCQIPEQFLLTEVVTKKGKVIKKNVKVKLCHNVNNNPHTIVISCNALNAHRNHQNGSDYIGACEL